MMEKAWINCVNFAYFISKERRLGSEDLNYLVMPCDSDDMLLFRDMICVIEKKFEYILINLININEIYDQLPTYNDKTLQMISRNLVR